MTLRVDVRKCSDFESITENERYALGLMCMDTMMGEITEKNWKDFYVRMALWEKLYGPLLRNGENGEPWPVTPEFIKRYIGLEVNVITESFAAFKNHVIGNIKRDLEYQARKVG